MEAISVYQEPTLGGLGAPLLEIRESVTDRLVGRGNSAQSQRTLPSPKPRKVIMVRKEQTNFIDSKPKKKFLGCVRYVSFIYNKLPPSRHT